MENLKRLKIKNPKTACFQFFRWCIYHANICYNANDRWHLNICEQDKVRAQLSWVWIEFYNLGALSIFDRSLWSLSLRYMYTDILLIYRMNYYDIDELFDISTFNGWVHCKNGLCNFTLKFAATDLGVRFQLVQKLCSIRLLIMRITTTITYRNVLKVRFIQYFGGDELFLMPILLFFSP